MIKITDKKQCCGCASCVQVCPKQCIEMFKDNEGFLYPKVNHDVCIQCGLCEKACPVLHPYDNNYSVKVFAAINTNDEVRLVSSSGGVFTALSEETIKKGGVVFGCRFDDEWQALIDSVQSIEELPLLRGSKYFQAQTGDSYIRCKNYLEEGKCVLFSGTPCQISGLLHNLNKPYPNLLTVEIVCHGTPSPEVWSRYLDEVVTAGEKARKDKSYNELERYSFSIKKGKNDDEILLVSDASINPYMKAFISGLIERPSCSACPAKNGRSGADITIADFWGINYVDASMDDDKGTSLVLTHSDKGLKAIPFDKLRYKEVCTDVLRFNPAYSTPSKLHPRRNEFYTAFEDANDLNGLLLKSLRPTLRQRIQYIKHPLESLKKQLRKAVLLVQERRKNRMELICLGESKGEQLSVDGYKIKGVSFRDKRNGWKSYRLSISLQK